MSAIYRKEIARIRKQFGKYTLKQYIKEYVYKGCGREFPLREASIGGRACLTGNCRYHSCRYYGSKKFVVEIEDIQAALSRGDLHDTLFVFFYKLWGLAGIEVMGGFNQVEYLAAFKERLIELFAQIGNREGCHFRRQARLRQGARCT